MNATSTRNQKTTSINRINHLRNTMKKLALITLAAAALVSVANANDLVNTIASLYEQLLTNTRYSVWLSDDDVKLVDPEDGRELVNISQRSATQISIEGVIAHVPSANASVREEIRYRISEYNIGAAVGTLTYDQERGLVTIQHNVNPTRVNAAAMASVAVKVADAVRAEADAIDAMQEEIRVAECATNRELCRN